MPTSAFWSSGGSDPPRASGNSDPASPRPPPDPAEPALRKWPLAARVAIIAAINAVGWFGASLVVCLLLASAR
jgi:hypothetical protein